MVVGRCKCSEVFIFLSKLVGKTMKTTYFSFPYFSHFEEYLTQIRKFITKETLVP